MPSVILGLALLAFWLYCLFDVITTPESSVRNLPKPMWLLFVLLIPVIGGLLWLSLGRPHVVRAVPGVYERRSHPSHPSGWALPPRTQAPRGPDDDPEFLRSLERRLREED